MATDPVRFRPHHVLCALGFQGKGYSPGFTANMEAIVSGRLRAPGGDATPVTVTGSLDDICAPCPKRRGSACSVQAKIDRLDAAHAAALHLVPGDTLTWGQAQRRIRDNVPSGSLAVLCAGCEWEPSGMCETALADLHALPLPEDQAATPAKPDHQKRCAAPDGTAQTLIRNAFGNTRNPAAGGLPQPLPDIIPCARAALASHPQPQGPPVRP